MSKAEGFEMLKGHIEMDEAYGGRRSGGKSSCGAPGKTVVFGMHERGGRTVAEVVPDWKTKTLREVTLRNVDRCSIVTTDELSSYSRVRSQPTCRWRNPPRSNCR